MIRGLWVPILPIYVFLRLYQYGDGCNEAGVLSHRAIWKMLNVDCSRKHHAQVINLADASIHGIVMHHRLSAGLHRAFPLWCQRPLRASITQLLSAACSRVCSAPPASPLPTRCRTACTPRAIRGLTRASSTPMITHPSAGVTRSIRRSVQHSLCNEMQRGGRTRRETVPAWQGALGRA